MKINFQMLTANPICVVQPHPAVDFII